MRTVCFYDIVTLNESHGFKFYWEGVKVKYIIYIHLAHALIQGGNYLNI
jgi:hypothetical protein